MSVYKKLMEARLKLQAMTLKKSGHNKFAGYTYFELGDFLPAIQDIFSDVGLCGVISFDKELATLTIVDTESNGEIKITSPMEGAALKGCHPIQNLGAVETYTRRYLWVTAMEIVEHDVLDATTGSSKPEPRAARTQGNIPTPGFEASRLAMIEQAVTSAVDAYNAGDIATAHEMIYGEELLNDNEERLEAWGRLKDMSAIRTAIKKYRTEHHPVTMKEAA